MSHETSQPVVFVIHDDAAVVRTLRDHLSRRFGEDFRIIAETSVTAGLSVLRGLAGSGEPVALLIVGHQLSDMPGVDFLARAHELHRRGRPLPVDQAGGLGRRGRRHRGAPGA